MAAAIISYLFLCYIVSQIIQPSTAQSTTTTGDGSPYGNPVAMGIVGGNESLPHKWPWQVFIVCRINSTHTGQCGGSIISDRWVLTAAHCVKGYKSHVVYGCKHLLEDEPSQEAFGVTESIIHHSYYAATSTNDIALLKLNRTIKFSPCMKPVRLPKKKVSVGKVCTATGWGRDETGKPAVALRQVDVHVRDPEVCSKTGYDMTGRICAGEPGKGIHRGDSGGPLVCRQRDVIKSHYYQQGISSCVPGIEVGGCGHGPQIYVRVCCYLKWINLMTDVYGGLSTRVTVSIVFGVLGGVVLLVLVFGLIYHMRHDRGDT